MQEISELQSFTVEEFQSNFDDLMNRVEKGESITITSNYGNAIMVPYKEVVEIIEDSGLDEELIRLHTEHEEGS